MDGERMTTTNRTHQAPIMDIRKYFSTRPHYWMYSHVFIFSILSLAWSIADVVFSVMLSRTSLIGLSSAVAAIALISLITTVVLIIFNRKPESNHRLTRVSTHYYSLAVIALLMFIIAIPLLAHTPGQCKRSGKSSNGKVSEGMLCGWLYTTVAYTWCCALFAGIAVFLLHRQVNKSNVRLEMSTTNVASIIRVRDS